MQKRFNYLAVAISTTLVLPFQAQAQEGALLAIEEIIVTARKTEENLQGDDGWNPALCFFF